MSDIKEVHPEYAQFVPDWVIMRDLYDGERAVKDKGEDYLPATQSMRLDGMLKGQPGRDAYDAYKLRAVFHEYVKEAVESAIGKMHAKPANIELPPQLEGLMDKATPAGESLQLLLRRINEEQLVTGRAGLLLDLPETPDPANPLPFIALYAAEAVRNWDGLEALEFVILDESGFVRDGYQWTHEERYRFLSLSQNEDGTSGPYAAVLMDAGGAEIENTVPEIRGKKLETIPFVFVNAKDIVSNCDEPPIIGLGRLSLAVYRSEADYRWSLFLQGSDTLVTIGATQTLAGENKPVRVGPGGRIDVDMGGDAKYIGVSSDGLPEQRMALEYDRAAAEARAGMLANASAGANTESGVALSIRVAAQTASLTQIALAGAAALERILKMAAEWMGASPDAVVVTPNLEFAAVGMSGQDLLQYAQAKAIGAPISNQSLHALAFERGLTSMTFEQEMDAIEAETAGVAGLGDADGE